MFQPVFLKSFKALLLSSLLLVIGGVTLLSYQKYTANTRQAPAGHRPLHNRNPALEQEIRGLNFDGFQGERRVLTIKAAKLSIEKKKMGMFRFGLLQEAHLEDAVIDIYMEEDVSAKDKVISTHSRMKTKQVRKEAELSANDSVIFTSSRTETKKNRQINLEKFLSKETLPPLKGKHISSIVINPVQIALYKGTEVLSRISAAKASIRLSKHDIVFEGNVNIAAGTRSLNTNRLSLLTNRGRVITDLPYVLTNAGDKVHGNGLVTDIFLSSF